MPENFPKTGPEPEEVGHWLRFRLGFLYVTVLFYFGLVLFRLIQLQVWPNKELTTLALKQFERTKKIAPPRLAIYDRNREELAVSIPAASAFVRPRLVQNKRKTAQALTQVLGKDPKVWLQKIRSRKSFVWIERQMGEDAAKQLAKKNLTGLYIVPENKRIYPNGQLAAHVLGFTDVDGNGISGIELAMNEELLRQATSYSLVRDGKGTPSYIDSKAVLDREDGRLGVFLTIDRRVQYVVEEELEHSLETTGARAGWAIVMDPQTGEIYAMAQRPTYDSNDPGASDPAAQLNRLLSHVYEPGSTLKPLLAAAAMESGVLTEKTIVDCGQGKLKVADRVIREAESDHKYGRIPVEKVIQVSSNIGAAKIAQLLGVERVVESLTRFGLTKKTGIRLPGETSTPLREVKSWNPVLLATTGFGQGIATTAIQMVAGYAPLANGGNWVRPKILRRESREETHAERKILSPRTVDQMRKILVRVTEEKEGTGMAAQVPGMHVAGKTGTAQKYEPGVGYRSDKYYSSFIGFLPAEKPELLIGVMLDEPKRPYYASVTAAPLFSRIATRSIQVLNRVPKTEITENEVLRDKSEIETAPTVPIFPTTFDSWVIPDLRGYSVREALRAVGSITNHVNISGEGYVLEQSPVAGTTVTAETVVSLKFSPNG